MKLDTRQKILIPLIVIAFAYVIWQVVDMVGSDHSRPTASKTSTSVPSAAPVAATPTTATATTTAATVTPQPTAAPQQQPLTESQSAYLQLMNQYQLVKMQRLIVDEQASIAEARERIAKLNQEAGSLGGSDFHITGSNTQSSDYKLVFLDRQSGIWSATLSKDGRYYEVGRGKELLDGTQVVQINDQGVVLRKDGEKTQLTFSGSAPYSSVHDKQRAQDKKPKSSQLFQAPPKATTSRTTPATEAVGAISTEKADQLQRTKPTVTQQQPNIAPLTSPSSENKQLLNEKNKPQVNAAKTVKKAATTITPKTIEKTKKVAATKATTVAIKTASEPKKTAATPAKTTNKAASTSKQPAKTKVTWVKATPENDTTPLPPKSAVATKTNSKPTTAFNNDQEKTFNQLDNYLGDNKTEKTKTTTPVATSLTDSNYNKSSSIERLLNSPHKSYTVQLLGSRDKNELTTFVKKNHLNQTKAMTFKTYYLGKDWYVLVYGIYPNSRQALAAIDKLPTKTQHFNPWIRPLSSVQKAIHLDGKAVGLTPRFAFHSTFRAQHGGAPTNAIKGLYTIPRMLRPQNQLANPPHPAYNYPQPKENPCKNNSLHWPLAPRYLSPGVLVSISITPATTKAATISLPCLTRPALTA